MSILILFSHLLFLYYPAVVTPMQYFSSISVVIRNWSAFTIYDGPFPDSRSVILPLSTVIFFFTKPPTVQKSRVEFHITHTIQSDMTVVFNSCCVPDVEK